jgi:peptidoglycan/LPS O-acetylase OafA/YrhL
MRRLRAPLFLARAVYRRRRLRDAARLLPLVGFFLLILPMLWQGPDGSGRDVVYIFAIWAGLIAVAAILAPGLHETDTESLPDEGDD